MNTITARFILVFLSFISCTAFGQGAFPITANIGYAAAMNEVKTHFSVPGATPGSPGDPYSYQVASGSYSVYFAPNNTSGKIMKPIIISEGFDPTQQYSCDKVIALLNGATDDLQDNLADQLRLQGYDLIVLDYQDGGQLIQRNAFLLMKLIQHINATKASACPIILAGFSMGGIVSRYALNYMEANALPHNVGLFFSFDAPHKGANIPLSMQDMIDWLDNNVVTYGLSTEIQEQARSMHSYAAQQMLIYHTDYIVGDVVNVNPAFTSFYAQMKGLIGGNGYPKKCKMIAASLGNWTGLGQAYMNNANNWVDHNGSLLPTNPLAFSFSGAKNAPFIGYALSGIASPLPYNITIPVSGFPFAIMYISVASAIFNSSHITGYYNAPIPADVMPGSFTPIFQLVANSLNGVGANSNIRMPNGCFIPTVSALDFNTDNWYHNIAADANRLTKTPFSSIFATVGNFDHRDPLAQHSELADWVMNEVSIFNATVDACEDEPLPVKLSSFRARKEGETALLNWKTVSEVNFDHFSIERSGTGKKWDDIGKVFPNEDLTSEYSFSDQIPLKGESYYRLKMIDKDGSFAYSQIQKLEFELEKTFIYPNPAGGDDHIRLMNGDKIISEVQIFDKAGRKVYQLKQPDAEIDIRELASGHYIMKVIFENGSESSQLFVKE
ncbi:T9SS type A sorting domain-containing protein [Dyadobacter sp. CY343]|uniref:T9SS type A sorting domain-containing protein n=1 Tax=Dyadobacter sp. CY343 TaxID=2907299 RepID=UPI001F370F8A|nr:T9SS type A sorting domain-containing protein [Dyadobacter sp. CY343]MCE7059527.1 T9SS type A sorting domain-containing protein [Dyadobacter sp. CY343]